VKLARISDDLAREIRGLSFSPPVAYVYNPLEYAADPNREYLERWARRRVEVLFLGMNPGPWGMAQTGIPFGAVSAVRDWLGIEAEVGKPAKEHPKRPVEGFRCRREEVSGARLWGWARDVFGTPERFFARFFVANYCPLLFLEESGRNLTPDKLDAGDREAILGPCDRALRRLAEELEPARVVGVGQYAEARARAALEGLDVTIGRVLHPSPASPAANRGWGERAAVELREMGVEIP
jgi:single-strand selective monofunctional uracil DNA glycosylase